MPRWSLSLQAGGGSVSALCPPLHSSAAVSPRAFAAHKTCAAAFCLSVLCPQGWLFHGEKEFSCFAELHVAIFPSSICYPYGDAQCSPEVLSPTPPRRQYLRTHKGDIFLSPTCNPFLGLGFTAGTRR